MAILGKNGSIRGAAGSMVFRGYRDKTIMQGRPGRRRKQTLASTASACEFGLISSTAKVLKEAFKPLYGNRHDGGMHNRLNSAASKAIRAAKDKKPGERDLHDGELAFLEGLEFNAHSPFCDALLVKPGISRNEEGKILISLPAISEKRDIRSPFKRLDIWGYRIRFVVLALSCRELFMQYVATRETEIAAGEQSPATEWLIAEEPPKGCILMVGAVLEPLLENRLENRMESLCSGQFCPAAILAAFHALEEAEPGYGVSYLTARDENGNQLHLNVSPIGYCGNELLERIRKLSGGKEKSVLPNNQQKSRDAEQQKEGHAQLMGEKRTSEANTKQAGNKKPDHNDWDNLTGKRIKLSGSGISKKNQLSKVRKRK